MATPAFVRALPASGSNGATSNTVTFAFDATGCDGLVVGFSYGIDSGNVSASTVTTATYAGAALTQLVGFTVNAGTTSSGMALYGITAPTTGSNNVIITMTGGTGAGTKYLTVSVVGYSGVGSFGNTATANPGTSSGNSPNCDVTCATGNLAVACGTHGFVIDGAGSGCTLRGSINDFGNGFTGNGTIAMDDRAGAGGATSMSFASTTSDLWTVMAVEVVGVSQEQEGFRFRNDDGSETTATWLAAQDTNASVALNTNFRLRTLINATGDPPSTAYTLNYKKSTDSLYIPVPTSSATAVPTWQANGAMAQLATAITPAFPTGILPGDILVLFLETANQAISIANAGGGTWTEIGTQTGTGTAGSTSATRLAMYWSRYDGVQTAPTTSDSGDHQTGFIASFRGCKQSGSPINATATFTTEAGPTTANIPGATTTVNNCLVVLAVADDWDNASTTRYTTWANANLTSINERFDNGSTTGNGGGLGMATATLATAAAYGTSTVAINASILANANGSFALTPADVPVFVSASSNVTAGGEATTVQLSAPSGKATSDFDTGRLWDDENGSDSIDITADDYTELEWSLRLQSPAVDADAYDFRVYAGSTALDTYTVTPRVTVGGKKAAPFPTRRLQPPFLRR